MAGGRRGALMVTSLLSGILALMVAPLLPAPPALRDVTLLHGQSPEGDPAPPAEFGGGARAAAPRADLAGDTTRRIGVVDTVIILRDNLFSEEEADRSFFLDVFNDLHITTRPWVIRREMLLEPGQPFDSARAAETERNLRGRRIFRNVDVDTTRLADDRLAAVVSTQDAWSVSLRVKLEVASDGTVTGELGGKERNFLGTGNVVSASYVREVDRDGMVLAARVPWVGPSRLAAAGYLRRLSDRNAATWEVGLPFRSLSDRWSVEYRGDAFDGRVLQFRTGAPADVDTVAWHRRALRNRINWVVAPRASPAGYLRVGAGFEVRREEHFAHGLAPEAVPDSVYGLVGAFVEWRGADFEALRNFNGFIEEDLDLSRLAFFGAKLAPGGWGYGETGVGARAALAAGTTAGELLLKGRVEANGLFNAAGLDSGRVSARGTAAFRPVRRHVTFLSLAGEVQDSPPPGEEIDLGFGSPPRLWRPHAFTGTRSLAATVEHRWYVWDELLNLFGLGFSGFLDYGGAWYPEQDRRLGGNVGIGIFSGSLLRSRPVVSQLSIGWRFGGGLGAAGDGGKGESRWAVTLGSGVAF